MKRIQFRRWVRAWSRRQVYSLLSSLGTLLNHRFGTIMTVLVLGIAMALPIGLYVALDNLRGIDLQTNEWGSITVFLHNRVTEPEVAELIKTINERGDAVAAAISPQQGMQEFRATSGFGAALDVLESNPLPWVLSVKPEVRVDRDLAKSVDDLAGWLGTLSAIESIQLDYKWMQRLAGLLNLGNALVSILSLMFSLTVVVVVANTIRMDVANRSEEIEVLALVGAGDSFIRQPFLYSGFWYGLLGSGLALVLLSASLAYLQAPLATLLDAYGNTFILKRLDPVQVGWMLLMGGSLGFLGAWVSVERYLRMLRRGGLLGRI
ncbi:MAG TPA: permease-like cell division protein FtsX [Xanthomonadales bacterium]|nr:permease-like cell division protein FtsX [Xanthomonadales bacterium]